MHPLNRVCYAWAGSSTQEDTDVLWFIDNEAAVSSLVKSTSKELDVHRIIAKPHMLYWASFPPGAGLSG